MKVWNDVFGIVQASATVTRASGFIGWTDVALSTPLIVTAGQTVRVGVDIEAGDFCARRNDSADYVNGDVTIRATGWQGALGTYPTTNFLRQFFCDVVFEKQL